MSTIRRGDLRRLGALVADLDAVVWEADVASGRFTYVSPRSSDILGHSPEEWIDEPTFWADHVHPDDREHALKEFMAGTTEGRPHDFEYRFLRGDGSVVWVRDIGHAVTDVDGAPIVVRGLMVDVTQQKLSEGRRSEVEQRYRNLVEQLPGVVYLAGVGHEREPGNILYVSPQVERILGYRSDEWIVDPSLRVKRLHPDDLPEMQQAYRSVGRTGGTYRADYRMFAKDGRIVWIHDEAVLVCDERGEPQFWQGVMFDTTEQRLADERAQASETRYRALVEHMPFVTYLDALEPSKQTLYVSPQVEALLGYTPEELTLDPPIWPTLIHPDDRERVLGHVTEAERRQGRYSIEYRMLTRDGQTVWVHDEAALLPGEDGKPLFWQGVWMDITERKRAAELERELEVEREESAQLREVDRMKNTFLQAVSHDLRTPLAAILGLAVTLERGDLELHPEDARDMARRIATNARRLDRMVNDLLDLDRLSRGIVEPTLKRTDVGSLVSRLIAESDVAGGREVIVDAPEVWADIDGAKVERIVENLLANAARYTPAGTRIWVRVSEDAGDAVLAVEDEGPGVPPEQREGIFEPFRQGPDTSEHSPGVGIGLALVARFTELHGGRVWVEDREGGGASFRVRLPLSPSS
jgi:PAS domain S-box-containing protein